MTNLKLEDIKEFNKNTVLSPAVDSFHGDYELRRCYNARITDGRNHLYRIQVLVFDYMDDRYKKSTEFSISILASHSAKYIFDYVLINLATFCDDEEYIAELPEYLRKDFYEDVLELVKKEEK